MLKQLSNPQPEPQPGQKGVTVRERSFFFFTAAQLANRLPPLKKPDYGWCISLLLPMIWLVTDYLPLTKYTVWHKTLEILMEMKASAREARRFPSFGVPILHKPFGILMGMKVSAREARLFQFLEYRFCTNPGKSL
jgi:hypothetical protein